MKGHTEEVCFKKRDAQKQAKLEVKQKQQSRQNSTPQQAHIAQIQYAGHASNIHSTPNPISDHSWLADTGATLHMTPYRHWLRSYTPMKIPITIADGRVIYSSGIGCVWFQPVVNGHKSAQILEFERVLHVPELDKSLFSVLWLSVAKSIEIFIKNRTLEFSRHNTCLWTASINSQYSAYLNGSVLPISLNSPSNPIACATVSSHSVSPPSLPSVSVSANASSTLPLDLSLWHQRFNHLNHAQLKQLISGQMITGIDITSSTQPDPICEPCLSGKSHRTVNKVATHRSNESLGLVHSDLHGPFPVATQEGFRYFVTFITDKGRFMSVQLLRQKSDTFGAFKVFKAWAELKTGEKVKILRHDKGGEYIGRNWDAFCALHGMEIQKTVRNEPHQNGVAERSNRTLVEGVISMLTQAKLPSTFWGYALHALVHTRNRSPTAALDGITPFESLIGLKPDASYFRIFGCLAYVNIQKDKRRGLQSHVEKCIFVRYPSGVKGWLFYNWVTKKFIISNAATFDERIFPGLAGHGVVDLAIPGEQPIPDAFFIEDEADQGGNDGNDAPPHPPAPEAPAQRPRPATPGGNFGFGPAPPPPPHFAPPPAGNTPAPPSPPAPPVQPAPAPPAGPVQRPKRNIQPAHVWQPMLGKVPNAEQYRDKPRSKSIPRAAQDRLTRSPSPDTTPAFIRPWQNRFVIPPTPSTAPILSSSNITPPKSSAPSRAITPPAKSSAHFKAISPPTPVPKSAIQPSPSASDKSIKSTSPPAQLPALLPSSSVGPSIVGSPTDLFPPLPPTIPGSPRSLKSSSTDELNIGPTEPVPVVARVDPEPGEAIVVESTPAPVNEASSSTLR